MTKLELKNRVLEIWQAKLANASMRHMFYTKAGEQRAVAICANEETRLMLEMDLIRRDRWGYSKLLLASLSRRY